MIQCANLMLGLDETAGLSRPPGLAVSVTAAQGFVAAGCHAGIKRRRFDMALIATDDRQAGRRRRGVHPEQVRRAAGRARPRALAANGGKAAAIIVNSGNANAGTGAPAHRRRGDGRGAGRGARHRQAHVLVCSTGIIGTPLPMDLILDATPKLAKKLSVDGGADAARGILTTDHKPRRRWSGARPSPWAAWPRAAA